MPHNTALSQEASLQLRTKLTPLQIQEIRILEYPTLELEQRIEKEVEENPALETGDMSDDTPMPEEDEFAENEDFNDNSNDEFDLTDYISDDDDVPDYRTRQHNQSPDDKQEDIPFSIGESFQENLLTQVGLLPLTDKEQQIAKYVVGNIDEDGYLRREQEALVDDLVFHANLSVTDEQMHHIVQLIQNTFEPAGVGAKDLQQCLLLQLNRKQETPSIALAKKILTTRYKEFTARHYDKIKERLQIDDDTLRAAIQEITKLNPKPGSTFVQDVYASNSIVPDFIISSDNGNIEVSLNNSNIPELHVNKEFNEMLQNNQQQTQHTKQEREAVTFIKDRIDSARWFIDAVKQRNDTLLSTMRTIVKLQRDFFVSGDESMLKPLILKDVAEKTGYDISTISRVCNSKYAQTEYGILPLKFFFSESIVNEDGEEVATRAIKNALLEIVNKEDKAHPINDDKMVAIMRLKGFSLARRTVAKYRKILGIPVARMRKQV